MFVSLLVSVFPVMKSISKKCRIRDGLLKILQKQNYYTKHEAKN